MWINKYLATQKLATRRAADALVKAGIVFINGRQAVPTDKVALGDKVEVRRAAPSYTYLAWHKPEGVTTPEADASGLFPLGRLDKDSSGLLILTNDGRLTAPLLSPEFKHEKEYIVTVKNKLAPSFAAKMERGVLIEGYKTRPCQVTLVDDQTFKIILTEGKKHQIRRMCAALGVQVAALTRRRIMHIKLGTLAPGERRAIAGKELEALLKSLEL